MLQTIADFLAVVIVCSVYAFLFFVVVVGTIELEIEKQRKGVDCDENEINDQANSR